MITKKMYFMDCHLAGRKYHDADEVWDELKVVLTKCLTLCEHCLRRLRPSIT